MKEETIFIKVDAFYSDTQGVFLQALDTQPQTEDSERRYYWCPKVGNIIVTNKKKEEVMRVGLWEL